jgi:hypothetical protein
MVNNTLPLPILKYLEQESSNIESIIQEYPFYLFPRIAQILKNAKHEGIDSSEFNFFGLNKTKLEQYTSIFQNLDITPTAPLNQEDVSALIENSESFYDVKIEVSEDSPLNLQSIAEENIPIEIANVTSEEAEESLGLTESSTAENAADINELDIEFEPESSFEQKELNEETLQALDVNELQTIELEKNLSDIEIIFEENTLPDEELADKILGSFTIDETITIPDLGPIQEIPDSNLNFLDIELDLLDTISDEELASKLNFEDENMPHTIVNEESGQFVEDENKLDANSIIEISKIVVEIPEKEIDESIVFGTLSEPDYIQPAAFEKLNIHKEDDDSDLETNSDDSEIDPIEMTIEHTDNAQDQALTSDVKDFTGWLASFSNFKDSIQDNAEEIIDSETNNNEEDELNRSIQSNANQHILLESMDKDSDSPKINRDDELEGVLKDNYFKNQVEIKKASRKTPSEMRIQDEAQMSLRPLDLISETIAILHEQQGNTTKAIEIYEKLIVLIPEKSSFFALQIENLRK